MKVNIRYTVETKGAIALAEINGKFDKVIHSIDTVKEKQHDRDWETNVYFHLNLLGL